MKRARTSASPSSSSSTRLAPPLRRSSSSSSSSVSAAAAAAAPAVSSCASASAEGGGDRDAGNDDDDDIVDDGEVDDGAEGGAGAAWLAPSSLPAASASSAAPSAAPAVPSTAAGAAKKPVSGAVPLGGAAGSAATSPALAATVTLVLEQASLESVKTKKGFELLNCDDHQGLHRKAGRDPAESRPDILHQLLLVALDSPLNKSGHLRVLVQTRKGVLIEISPHTRIPRTFKRFAGLMVQLLHKLRVRAADGSDTLLKVVKNPVTAHLPIGATVVGLEMGARLVDAFDLPPLLPQGRPVVFVVGAMSHGDITADYITQTFSLSRFPLSAACAVSKLLNAFEHSLGIL